MKLLFQLQALALISSTISQNIALDKTTSSNGVVDGRFPAYKAVNGVRQNRFDCTILKSTGGELSRWSVDLEDSYIVQQITIYNAVDGNNARRGFTNFVLSVGLDLDNLTNCGDPYIAQPLPYSSRVDISCDQVGHFVFFRKTDGVNDLTGLCEVEVYGIKIYDCNLCPTGIDCTPRSGCSHCAPGKKPLGCDTDCNDGTYGMNCSKNCGRCASGTVCDKVTGVCSSGCQRWWIRDKCDTKITAPKVTIEAVRVASVTNNSATIEWDSLVHVTSELAEFYQYQVRYRERTGSYQDGPLVSHGPSPLSAELTGLKHNTEYLFSIDTYRVMGNNSETGGSYSFVRGITQCNSPAAPVITVDSSGGNELTLGPLTVISQNMSSLDSGCFNISSLQVEYRHVDVPGYTTEEADVFQTTYTVRVDVSGEYEVRLVVTNNEGLTAASLTQTVTVHETRLDPVTTTTTTPTTQTTVSTPDYTPNRQSNTGSSQPPTTAIAASVVVVILVAAAVGVGIFFWRRRRNSRGPNVKLNTEDAENVMTNSNPSTKPREPEQSEPVGKPETRSAADRKNTKGKKSLKAKKDKSPGAEEAENIYANSFGNVIPVPDFEAYVTSRKLDIAAFEREYDDLPKEDMTRCIVATTEDNLAKNRYKNIYAYDSSRVILFSEDGSEPDYINASYISGFKTDKDYIATQGPRNSTVEDFWMMIWQEKSNTIVMVANIVENGKNKCAEYWSTDPDESLEIGKFTIRTEAVNMSADYNTTILSIQKGEETRAVRHFHFTTWEDKGDPIYGIHSLLDFYRKVHSFDSLRRGPMVVHCSAGVGRTGTFIVLDILMQEAEVQGQIEVLPRVQKARTERMHMVQTLGQYFYIYDVMVEYIKCANTSLPCGQLTERYKAFCETAEGKKTLKRQFQLLREAKQTQNSTEKDGLRPEHKDKNRNLKFIPDDACRPVLLGKVENNYINAVFMDSFRHHSFYIVTQLPLAHTLGDFWRLVHSQASTTIVCLQNIPQEEQYWPSSDEKVKEYSGISVELTNIKQINSNLVTRTFNISKVIRKSVVTEVKLFQLLSWPDDEDVPPNTGHLLGLTEHLLKWQQETGINKPEGCTVIQCLDGVAHSGLYCAMNYVLEKMKLEQEVDPFFAVRHACRNRQFLQTLAQYDFLYRVARDHMEQHNEYANV